MTPICRGLWCGNCEFFIEESQLEAGQNLESGERCPNCHSTQTTAAKVVADDGKGDTDG